MIEILRLASAVISRVLSGRNLDAELRTAWMRHPSLSGHQRALIQDASYGTLRYLGCIDAMVDALLDKPLSDPHLRDLLRVAVYQLEYTHLAPHAIVDHAVRCCEALGFGSAKSLTNAVLRNFQRRHAAVETAALRSDVGRYSHPQWWIDKLRAQYPAQHESILEAGNRHPPLALRVNARRITRDAYLSRLTQAGINARAVGESAVLLDTPRAVEQIPGFDLGWVSVQDAAAQQAALWLDAAPATRVLDAFAAPGGKAAHILERADVDLFTLDCDAGRLERVGENFSRLGLTAHLLHGDASKPEAWWDGTAFDCILADVPCSASGVVRRHPDIKWLRRPDDIARFAQQQALFLDVLWRLLRRDGKLLYATCSVFQEENSFQIAHFLGRHPDARCSTPPGTENSTQAPAGQSLPDEDHDGFFYALLQKH
ncbi:MAG TPA: 16S rRNA (cytosine(967)-C(5))-methyltransferase RsmB [Burkholderiales bacterium]|nr:16S rRNA (cytosine(967)-C(5))-methyltransferase RsmB [Burkholderiales bacterium]